MGFFDDLKESIDDARERKDERRKAKQERKDLKADRKEARREAKLARKDKKSQDRREDRKERADRFDKFLGEGGLEKIGKASPIGQITGIFKDKEGGGKIGFGGFGANLTKIAVIAGVGLGAVVLLK